MGEPLQHRTAKQVEHGLGEQVGWLWPLVGGLDAMLTIPGYWERKGVTAALAMRRRVYCEAEGVVLLGGVCASSARWGSTSRIVAAPIFLEQGATHGAPKHVPLGQGSVVGPVTGKKGGLLGCGHLVCNLAAGRPMQGSHSPDSAPQYRSCFHWTVTKRGPR